MQMQDAIPEFMTPIIFESEQFARIKNIDISTSGNKPLGLVIEIDLPTNQGYISDVVTNSLASHIKNWRTELIGSFMTRVNDDLVFTANGEQHFHHHLLYRYSQPSIACKRYR